MKKTISLLVFLTALGASMLPLQADEPTPAPQSDTPKMADKGETAIAYLGIDATDIDPAMRAQITIPKGVGVLIRMLMPKGPAVSSGLKQFDILTKFDDQLIVNAEQLTTLIRMKHPGDVVAVTTIRAGVENVTQVTLGSRPQQTDWPRMEDLMRFNPGMQVHPHSSHMNPPPVPPVPPVPPLPPVPPVPGKDTPDSETGNDGKTTKIEIRHPDNHSEGKFQIVVDGDTKVDVDLSNLKESLTTLKQRMQLFKDKIGSVDFEQAIENLASGDRTTIISMNGHNVVYTGPNGTITLREDDGQRKLTAVDSSGTTLYDGILPENYEEVLPPNVVNMLQSIEDLRGVDLNFDESMPVDVDVDLESPEVDDPDVI